MCFLFRLACEPCRDLGRTCEYTTCAELWYESGPKAGVNSYIPLTAVQQATGQQFILTAMAASEQA
jgi:hypothetical protein